MFYTGKGDKGKSILFDCDQKVFKDDILMEALGELDELNSFLGVIKAEIKEKEIKIKDFSFADIIHQVQQDLFIIQAELAGADKRLKKEKIKQLEDIINKAEKEIPPINSFAISGSSITGSKLDLARTIVRRVERRVVAVKKIDKICDNSLAYLNRLSSLFYALARLFNHKSGITEESPSY
ncbi:MAG: cob(I)yrinic acid a,c-diamide adenosyltransferase [Patescibacteria group bacterium]